MPFTVLSYTREEIESGAGLLPTKLSEKLMARLWEVIQTRKPILETCQVETYFLNRTLNAASFGGLKATFGGEAFNFVFLNKCAISALEHFKIPINPVGTIGQLPQGVGIMLNAKLAII